MSRTRRFIDGVMMNYLQLVASLVVGLWMAPFVLKRLGRYDYGLWLASSQLLAFIALLDIGAIPVLARDAAFACGRAGSPEAADLPFLIGRTLRMLLWQLPLVVLAAAVTWLSLPATWGPMRAPLVPVLVAFVVLFPFRIFPAVLEGLQDLKYIGKVQLAMWAISNLMIFGMLLGGVHLFALAISWVVVETLRVLAYSLRIRSRYRFVLPKSIPKLTWNEAKAQLGRNVWMTISKVSVVLLAGTDLLVVGKGLGPAAVVVYACTAKLVAMLDNQPRAIMEAARPGLSELKTGGSPAELLRVCSALAQAMLAVSGGIVCVALVVNHGFVAWWIGEPQWGGAGLSALLLANMLVRHFTATCIYAVFSMGHDRRLAVTSLVDGIVTVSLAFVLMRFVGLRAFPIASLASALLVSIPTHMATLRLETKSTTSAFLAPLWPWAWRTGVLLVVAAAVGWHWMPRGFFALAATSTATTLIYVAVIAGPVLRSPLGVYLRPRVDRLRLKLFPARASS